MKILVIGLDCAAPELLFGDGQLQNIRRLMHNGCFGRLESVIPPITVPAWMCMSTSQDPGSLGVYGFRNRQDYSYDHLGFVTSNSIRATALWDVVAAAGKQAHIIGVPPSYPPRRVSGICVGCFLTPDTQRNEYTFPPAVKTEIASLVGEYSTDVKDFRTDNKVWLLEQIYAMSRKHFQVIRHYLTQSRWDYFQFVEIGLDRIQHGFWQCHDPQHRQFVPGNPYQQAIRDYYRYLDDEIGSLLALLDEETTVLVVSDHGAQRLDGGFCVNEWLVREGLLVLHQQPREVTPFQKLAVDWDRTTAWSEGGYYARVFLNVKGREPNGIIPPSDYERIRDDIKSRLEATQDDRGMPLGTLVFKPQEIYRAVQNVAPDLIAHFGGLFWRSIGGVGYSSIHIQENDTGPDACNHAQFGAFILSSPATKQRGELQGIHLLDIAPNLCQLGGYDTPASMQGRTFHSTA